MYEQMKAITGWTAVLGTGGYIMAAAMASSDGPNRGVEIPRELSMISVSAVCVLGVISMVMRIADHSNRVSAERDVRCVVADELQAQLAKLVADELIVAGVDARLKANNRDIREMVKAEVAGALEEATTRAYRAALVRDAQSAANGATVHRIPSRHEG